MTSCKGRSSQSKYISGYTGYIPQYIYRSSDSYGALMQKTPIDFNKKHAENIILTDDYRIEKQDLENKRNAKNIMFRTAMPDTTDRHISLGERSFKLNEYRYPLSAVRPDVETIENNDNDMKDLPEPPPLPYSEENFFNFSSDNINSEHSSAEPFPYIWPKFGYGNKAYEDGITCDFVNNYHHRRSEEWPITTKIIMGSSKSNSSEIYSKHRGIIPHYTGHVPGQKFSVGVTYTAATVDAKHFLNELS